MDRINSELIYFLSSIVWGVIILILYDMIRVFRRIVRHNWLVSAIEDILYWILCAFLIFRMMYIRNNGTIRSFSILGMFLGMVVYNQSISPLFVKGISNLILWFIKLLGRIVHFVSRPICFIGRRLKWLFLVLFKKGKKTGKIFSKPLKSIRKTFKISLKKR